MHNGVWSGPVPGRFLAKRHWILAVVLGIGLTLSLVGYQQTIGEEHRRIQAELVEDGEALYRSVVDDAAVAVAQIRALEGLFRASEVVTASEFQSFTESLGSTPFSLVVYAERIENGPSGSWPVLYAVSLENVGEDVGFNLGSDPVRLAAIEDAVASGEPVSSGFTKLPDDNQAGDIMLFQSLVTRTSAQQGVVGVVVQLDELIEQRAATLLNHGERWQLTEGSSPVVASPSVAPWTTAVQIADRGFFLTVIPAASPASRSSASLVLLGGAFVTLLTGLLIEVILRQRRSNRELMWLRRSSEDKDRFLSGVAHELRTPLAAVVGLLDLVTKDSQQIAPAERHDLLMVAREQAHELAGVVDDFMVAGRLAADTLSVRAAETQLGPLLADAAAEVRQYREIEIRFPTNLGAAVTDGVRIRQILRNLFSFVIRTGATFIDVSSHLEGRQVSVEIASNSRPVPDANRDRLFEPFGAAPLEGQPQPIELGLAVSRRLARRMRGDLTYGAIDGKSTFTLKLPTSLDDVQSRPGLVEEPAVPELVHPR